MNKHYSFIFLILLSLSIFHAQALVIANPPEEKNLVALNTPPDFGKTHFIVGMPPEQLQTLQHSPQPAARSTSGQSTHEFNLIVNGKVKQAYFAPDDRIHDILIYVIEKESSWIKVAAFMLTDKSIAQALGAAQERGVQVEVVVDPGCVKDKFNKIEILREKNCQVFVYNPDYNNTNKNSMITSLMHHKFLIFGSNVEGKKLLINGSLNLTNSAHKIHQENIFITDDEPVIDQFLNQFDILKTRCGKGKKQSMVTAQRRKKERFKVSRKNAPKSDMILTKNNSSKKRKFDQQQVA